jgi:hypothetical protein
MTAYAQKCPKSKLILAGYSSGGQGATDILAGGGGELFNGCIQPDTPPLDSAVGDKSESSPKYRRRIPIANSSSVAAVIVFGDVRHTANQTYNFGNGSAYDGWFPRTTEMLANLNKYADRMRDWCVVTDPICAAHLPNYDEESHLDYYNVDSQAAASWIKSVASLTDDSSFTTVIPTSLSGTAQDYATIGTATPSGSVTLDTTWTDMVSYTACTASSYSQGAPNGTSAMSSSSVSSTTGTASITKTPVTPAALRQSTGTAGGGAATGTGKANASPTAAGTNAGAVNGVTGGLCAMVAMILAVMFM